MTEIDTPPDLTDDADEIARVFIDEGDSVMQLRNLFGDEDAERLWGFVLADLTVHVARMLRATTPTMTDEAELVANLQDAMQVRLRQEITHTSSLPSEN